MKRVTPLIGGINLIIGLVLLNLLLAFYPLFRLDLTKNKIHSLSSASQKIIKSLDDVLNIEVYLSRDLPAEVQPAVADLKTILAQIERTNPGKIKIEYMDMQKPEIRQKAENLGIRVIQFSTVKEDKFEMANAYLGLVVRFGAKKEVMPVVGNVGNLEYAMVSTVNRIAQQEKKTVMVAEINREPGQIKLLEELIGGDYDVLQIDLISQELDENADSLVIVGKPAGLTEETGAKLDKWLNAGKGLILLVDRVEVNGSMSGQLVDSYLWTWLENRGIKVLPKLVWDESSAIANFRTQQGSFLTKYPFWLEIRGENVNKAVPAVSGLANLTLPWAQPVEASTGEKLFWSSIKSGLYDQLTDLTPETQVGKPGEGNYSLGWLDTDGVKLALVADSDFVSDQFGGNNQANIFAAMNLIDLVTADSDLAQIRSKLTSSQPLGLTDDKTKTIIRLADLTVPIAILVGAAVVIFRIRKLKNEQWLN